MVKEERKREGLMFAIIKGVKQRLVGGGFFTGWCEGARIQGCTCKVGLTERPGPVKENGGGKSKIVMKGTISPVRCSAQGMWTKKNL